MNITSVTTHGRHSSWDPTRARQRASVHPQDRAHRCGPAPPGTALVASATPEPGRALLFSRRAGLRHVLAVPGPVLELGVLVAGQQAGVVRSEEHTSELQSRFELVCRLLLEKK